MFKSKLTLTIIGIVCLITSCQITDKSEVVYIKQLTFNDTISFNEKVKMAAHVVPTKQQLDWQKLEMTAFIHFSINTFTDQEWGHGDESPEIFNPVQLDTRQWVKTLKDTGMKLVILTAKHHDGFCLWPTQTTHHSVASSPWKNGKGDVVKELREACEEFGMKFGIYLSPWDRNADSYGDSPKYNAFFLQQLSELLTGYGKVDEVWFDGAIGEGPNGKKQVYDWDAYYNKIYELQPEAVVAIVGEDIRWVGTESGYGRETEWSVTTYAPGGSSKMKKINDKLGINAMSKDLGSREMIEKASNVFWYPAEVDVSIRPGWFYHKSQDNQLKSLSKMVDIYFNSVGRNAVLLLNIPPDQRGLLHENDVARLQDFREYLNTTFKEDVLKGAKVSKRKVVVENNETYWKMNQLPSSIEYELSHEKVFNVLMLQEYIKFGQRVEKFRVEVMIEGNWKEIASSTTIGYKKLLRFPKVKTDKVKLTILKARDGALISNFGLFESPEILSDPVITRNKQGHVSIKTETLQPVITYTLDGSEPTKVSTRYEKPFELPEGGTVKARAFINDFAVASGVIREPFDVCPALWKVLSYSDQVDRFKASNAIDGDVQTMWSTHWDQAAKKHPHHIAIDLGEQRILKGFSYTPRADNNKSGTIFKYSFYVSNDGEIWEKVSHGEFSNIKNNPVKQEIRFRKTHPSRYIKLVSHNDIYNENWTSVGEIGIVTR